MNNYLKAVEEYLSKALQYGKPGPNDKRKTWDKFRCNEILKIGKCLSCDERYGWKYMNDWINKKRNIINGISNITCATNLNINKFNKEISITKNK